MSFSQHPRRSLWLRLNYLAAVLLDLHQRGYNVINILFVTEQSILRKGHGGLAHQFVAFEFVQVVAIFFEPFLRIEPFIAA